MDKRQQTHFCQGQFGTCWGGCLKDKKSIFSSRKSEESLLTQSTKIFVLVKKWSCSFKNLVNTWASIQISTNVQHFPFFSKWFQVFKIFRYSNSIFKRSKHSLFKYLLNSLLFIVQTTHQHLVEQHSAEWHSGEWCTTKWHVSEQQNDMQQE